MNAAVQLTTRGSDCGWRDRPYRETLDLRDRRRVHLRPARYRDAEALQAFFSALSPRSRLMRFHGAVNRLPDGVLRSFTTQVPNRHLALVAWAGTDDAATRMVAEARYVVDAENTGRGEFALAVADGWQGLGLGLALLRRLATHAASEGLVELEGSVLAGNEPMLGLLRRLGARFHADAAEVRAILPL